MTNTFTPTLPHCKMNGSRIVVGWLMLKANGRFFQTHEYAGAGSLWELPAQSVALVAYGRAHSGTFWGSIHGVRFDDWFQNRIGACLGSDNRDTTKVDGTVGIARYGYQLLKSHKKGEFRLASGWHFTESGRLERKASKENR